MNNAAINIAVFGADVGAAAHALANMFMGGRARRVEVQHAQVEIARHDVRIEVANEVIIINVSAAIGRNALQRAVLQAARERLGRVVNIDEVRYAAV